MAVKTRRSYAGAAVSTTLTSSIDSSTTSIVITAATGWASGSFYAVIDPGTASEEKVLVASRAGTTLTISARGVDGTTAKSHAGGAAIYPVHAAVDSDEANELTSTYASQGGIVYQGASTFTQLGIGAAGQVLKVNTGATAPEWGQVVSANIATDAITSDKIAANAVGSSEIAANAVTTAKVADGAITAAKLDAAVLGGGTVPLDNSVTSAKIVDGAIMNVDINASAAIALSKLATGALPTAITVASANIVDGTIALADLATAVINKLIPSGTISPYVGSSSPTGWLICDGTTVVGGQTAHPDLWAVLPTIYKSGSDIVLPNLKGRTVVGLDSAQTEFDAIGETGGAKTHTLTEAEIPSHSHSYTGPTGAATYDPNGAELLSTLTSTTTGTTGGGGAHNNLQPYITFNYIIKT